MRKTFWMYCLASVILTGCDGAGYAISGVGQAIAVIEEINDAADAYENQVLADLCAEDPGLPFCPGHCDVDPQGMGCPGYKGLCELFPESESCT